MLLKQSKMCFAVALVVLVVSVVMAFWGFPKLVNNQIQKNVQIDNSSKMYEKWKKLPIPLTFKIYVFNVTNPEEVNNGAKPKLKEMGPYVYKEYREKTILGYGPNDTIQYTLKKNFVFDEDESRGVSEDDEITIINLSYLGAVLAVQDLAPSILGLVNKALEHFFTDLRDPFLRVKVKDLFFDGIFLNCTSDEEDNALSLICGKIKLDKPPTMIPADDGSGYYFSMFSYMNRTETGPFEMIRGTENVFDLGHIVSYQGKNVIKKWGNEYCNQINGTDASIFPPIDENDVPSKLYIFEPDICRSLYVELVGKKKLFSMDAYYYEVSEQVLASKSANPNNKCYCKKNWSANHDGCLLMGVLNLAPCQGAPAIASFPHFYLASEELLEYFGKGISPNKEKHNNYMYLDPVTGVVLKGVKRLQFNIELRNIPDIPQLAKVRTGLFPMLWIEEGAEIPEDIQEELKSSHTLLKYVEIARWCLLAIGIIAVLAAAIIVARSSSLNVWKNRNSVNFEPNVGDLYGNKR